MNISLSTGTVGQKAHEVSKTWSLGFHAFSTEHFRTLRLCYLRNKRGTHYIELTKDRKVYNTSA